MHNDKRTNDINAVNGLPLEYLDQLFLVLVYYDVKFLRKIV